MFAFGLHDLSIDDRTGPDCVALVDTWDFSHVAILAADALSVRGSVAILVPDDFQFDAGFDSDLVTGHAKGRLWTVHRIGSTVDVSAGLVKRSPVDPS